MDANSPCRASLVRAIALVQWTSSLPGVQGASSRPAVGRGGDAKSPHQKYTINKTYI